MICDEQLAVLFEDELACLRQLHDGLGLEYEALLAGDASTIERATRSKTRALGDQAKLAQRRQEFLTQVGFACTSEGLDSFIRGCDGARQLLDMRSEILALGQQCHAANRVNGRLIARQQQQTMGALKILRQVDQNTSTYSGAGDSVDSSSSRLLGKA